MASKRQLAETELAEAGRSALEADPGEVALSTIKGAAVAGRPSKRARLIAAVAVDDDETGEPFGFVAIESDLRSIVTRILNGMTRRTAEIYVTTADGSVRITSLPGFGVAIDAERSNVADLVPEVADFFASSFDQRSATDGKTFIVRRVQLAPNQVESRIGIVLRLSSEE